MSQFGHFTLGNNVIVETESGKNLQLRDSTTNDIILTLSSEAAYDLGHTLISMAFRAERNSR